MGKTKRANNNDGTVDVHGESNGDKKRRKRVATRGRIGTDEAAEKYNLIAELSESVLENPDSSFFSKKNADDYDYDYDDDDDDDDEAGVRRRAPSRVKRLIDMADDEDGDENLRRFAMVSLLAVFRDVLPSYRIRLPTKQELSVRVSKEVKRTRDYERALLTHYRWYLKVLSRAWERSGDGNADPIAATAMMSWCELWKTAPHFNFRSEVSARVVRRAATKRGADDALADACADALGALFAADPTRGEASLEAVRLLAKTAANRRFRVRPAAFDALLRLPLTVDAERAAAAAALSRAENKRRRADPDAAAVERELAEASAVETDKAEAAKTQSEILSIVMRAYFMILKTDPEENADAAALLPSVLRGLARFSHLVDFDTVRDLLKVLKGLLTRSDALPFEAALNAVLTAFAILQGPGRELPIDQKEYVAPLYGQLARISSCPDPRSTLPNVMRCLTAALLKRREHSIVRVAAFVRRLTGDVCLHAPSHASLPLLVFARRLQQRYSSASSDRLSRLTESEADNVGGAPPPPPSFDDDDDGDVDPDDSRPFSSSAWELALLRFHARPDVRRHAAACAANEPLRLPAEAPERVLEDALDDLEDGRVACRVRMRRHPLAPPPAHADGAGSAKRNRERRRPRFVKPRRTAGVHLQGFNAEQTRAFVW